MSCQTAKSCKVLDTVPYRSVRSVSAHIRYSSPPFPSRPTFRLISDDSGVPGESRPKSCYRDFADHDRKLLQGHLCQIATERAREREKLVELWPIATLAEQIPVYALRLFAMTGSSTLGYYSTSITSRGGAD
ncbi:hypothetical protein RHGRI_024004 [Rhododendron griersonianum]|uniref:Uncharacterized protein n=1 Tax=Rhododendron griersonianum TaxID=479676 RepID=A0AAV6J7W3_9ERIC|nr:hypothetical protein RHGRI_024004 [Rhododendron griersonianum]